MAKGRPEVTSALWGFHAVDGQEEQREMTDTMAMRMFLRGVIVGLFVGLYIGWAV
jgi:hypothetical protein